MLWEHRTVTLVSEDVIYERSRKQHALLFYNRAAPPAPTATPLALLTPVPRNWALHESKFAGVVPVQEAYSLQYVTPGSTQAPPAIFAKATPRPPDVEPEYFRADHSRYFSIVRRYVAQLVGYTFEVHDLNQPIWIDWVHPGQNAESAMFPFRQIPNQIVGQQFNLFYNQPKLPWDYECFTEPNPYVPTRYDIFFFPLPAVIPVVPILTFPTAPTNLRTSSTKPPIVLQWDPVLTATSYNIYRDNIVIASVAAPATTYTDYVTVFNRHYHYMVTAVNALGESPGSVPIFNVYIEPNGTLKFEIVWTQTAGHLGVPDVEWTWD